MIKLQAREIVRYSKRNKFKLIRMESVVHDNSGCVVAMIRNAVNASSYDELSEIFKISFDDIRDLEAGFEGWRVAEYWQDRVNKKYYKMGKRVAELTGQTICREVWC